MGSSLPPFNPAVTGVVVSNMAALQTLNPASFPVVTTRGYYSPDDGGGGTYDQLSGTPTADGGAIIAASGGYYKLRYTDRIHALKYGAYGDNTRDDSNPLQALQAYCSANKLWMDLSGPYTYRVTKQITLQQPCLYEGGMAVIAPDTTVLTSGFAVNFVGNGNTTLNSVRSEIRNLHVWGPQWTGSGWSYSSTSNVDGFSITGSTTYVGDVRFDGIEILGFRDNLGLVGPNNYIVQFRNFKFGGAWRNCINNGLTTNAGEKMSFIGGTVFNNINSSHTALAFNDTGTANGDFYFHDVSFDYNDSDFNIQTTRAWLYGCHMESNTNNSNVTMNFVSGNPWSEFRMFGGMLITGGGVPFFTGNTESAGGKSQWINVLTGTGGHYRITLDSVLMTLKSGSAIITPQDQILGQESIRGLAVQYSNAFLPAVNYYSSAVVNGRFNQLGGNINGWTLAPDANGVFSYDSATTVGNSRSMKFVSTVASTSNSQQILPFRAGDNILLRTNIKISSYSAGSTRAVLYFYAGDGVTLISTYIPFNNVSGTQAALSANTSGFASIGGIITAPAGTGKVVFSWEQTGLIANAWIGGTDAWKI
ncbi:MAG TPA: hypothetical protein VF534_27485 [Paraburkholderia sp.]